MTRMNGYSLGLRFNKAYENLNEDRPILSSPMTLDSGNIRFEDIPRGSMERGC